jgi:SAM-dependent methyltransferase
MTKEIVTVYHSHDEISAIIGKIPDRELGIEAALNQLWRINQWENVGVNQLVRIYHELDDSFIDVEKSPSILIPSIIEEVNRREKIAQNYLKLDKRIPEYLYSHLATDWRVLDSLFDRETPIAQALRRFCPLIATYVEGPEKVKLQSIDYSDLYEKAVERTIGQKLNGLINGDIRLFQTPDSSGNYSLDNEEFQNQHEFVKQLEAFGLLPLVSATILHLDVAKGGDDVTHVLWNFLYANKAFDPLVHNKASAILLRENLTFERANLLSQIQSSLENSEDPLTSADQKVLYSFMREITAFHGFIGQHVRGELTTYAFTGFTDWVRQNYDQLYSAMSKVSRGQVNQKTFPDFVSRIYLLVNLIDASAVREGLYTNELHQEFTEVRHQVARVISRDNDGEYKTNWFDIEFEEENKLLPVGKNIRYHQIYSLTDQIYKLRGKKDFEKIKGLLFYLPESIVESFYENSRYAQFWYAEPASAIFSVENQMKLIFLAMRTAEIKGIADSQNNDQKPYHINFIQFLNMVKPGGKVDKVRLRVIENYLHSINWDDMMDNMYISDLLNQSEKGIATFVGQIGRESSVGVDFMFPPKLVNACMVVNALSQTDDPLVSAAKTELSHAFGILRDNLDRGEEEERYQSQMDAAMEDKVRNLIPYIEDIKLRKKEGERARILSLGAGTGLVEQTIAKLIPGSDVVAVDYSQDMVDKITEKALELEGISDIGVATGKLIAVKADVTNLLAELDAKFGEGQEGKFDVVYFGSVRHEFVSFLDNYEFGSTMEKIDNTCARLINIGGIMAIRDFMWPENPDEIIDLEVGEKMYESETDPVLFLKTFFARENGFSGLTAYSERYGDACIDKIRSAVSDLIPGEKGAIIPMPMALTMEVAGHYSWAKSIKELRERYAYGTVKWHIQYLKEMFIKSGAQAEILSARTYTQSGYPEHGDGRFTYKKDGLIVDFPLLTGDIVIKKISL